MEPWNPSADNEAGRAFVESYQAECDETPNRSSLHTYGSMMVYANIIKGAGMFHPPTVVRAFEDSEWSLAQGDSVFRTCDYQVERPWCMVQGVNDDHAEKFGIRTEIVEMTDLLAYKCSELPTPNCAMGGSEYRGE